MNVERKANLFWIGGNLLIGFGIAWIHPGLTVVWVGGLCAAYGAILSIRSEE